LKGLRKDQLEQWRERNVSFGFGIQTVRWPESIGVFL
jgi:hypothetical protein